jgi:SAM-dependent methyltransferase
MGDTVERFSNRVENYIKFRPDYPREIIDYLRSKDVLTEDSVIADVGCGPGVSSRMFLENGNTVFGVEPNDAMRSAAERLLGEYRGFTPVNGRSDATSLPAQSVDIVIAAQAFHWFEPIPTRAEFRRILRPGGSIVLMWNIRQLDTTPFLVEYEHFLLRYGNDYTYVRHENITDSEIETFFDGPYETAVFPNYQIFDFEGLLGRVLSSSYMPDRADERFSAMSAELETLFAKHAENGRIRVLYDTRVHHSRF